MLLLVTMLGVSIGCAATITVGHAAGTAVVAFGPFAKARGYPLSSVSQCDP
jgi:flagellar biosynthesis component FlhA